MNRDVRTHPPGTIFKTTPEINHALILAHEHLNGVVLNQLTNEHLDLLGRLKELLDDMANNDHVTQDELQSAIETINTAIDAVKTSVDAVNITLIALEKLITAIKEDIPITATDIGAAEMAHNHVTSDISDLPEPTIEVAGMFIRVNMTGDGFELVP